MARIDGFGINRTIRDTRGRTDQEVGGMGNTIRFKGDHGRNTFHIGGHANNVTVQNIGRDDRVTLEGRPEDWQQLPDANRRDGQITLYNAKTGNAVTLATDAGRNDAFVKNRIGFTGESAGCPPAGAQACCCQPSWMQLGNLLGNAHCFDPFGFGAGNVLSTLAQGAFWNGMMALGPSPWSLNLNVNLW